MQMPLAQSVFNPQGAPADTLHEPAPSQAFAPPQVESAWSTAVLEQTPGEAGRLQVLQVPAQAESQQTLSAQLPLTQLAPSLHVVPLHALQLPPQSLPVSVPFWVLSEQVTQVWVVRSQEGVVPITVAQSWLLVQPTHLPAPSQTPAIPAHGAPFGVAGW